MKLKIPIITIPILTIILLIPNAAFSDSKTQKPLFSFGMLSDLQYCDCPPNQERFYKNSLIKLKIVREEFNKINPAFIVHLGDAIEKDLESFDPVITGMANFNPPFHNLLGNHDYKVNDLYKEMIIPVLDMPSAYYEFSRQGWRFIMLDGNDLSYYSLAQRNKGKIKETDVMFADITLMRFPQAKRWNGGIGHKQYEWLRNLLEISKRKKEKVILFCHFPVFPVNQHNLWNDVKILKLISGYLNIVAFFSGHNHDGNYALHKGIHHLTLKAMVDTKDQPAFSLVNLFSDKIDIKGYGREKDYSWKVSDE